MKSWYYGMTKGQRAFVWIVSVCLVPFVGIGLLPLAVLIYLHLGMPPDQA